MEDPQFASGASGFYAQDASSSVARTDVAPLEGAYSLHVGITGYGNNVWWTYSFAGGRASGFRASAHLRSDAASSSTLQFCVMVYYADGTELSCTDVDGSAGDKGTVAAALNLDSTRRLQAVHIRLIQQGGDPV